MLGPPRLFLVLVLALAVGAVTAIPPAVAAGSRDHTSYVANVRRGTNDVRAAHAKPRLERSSCLSRFARAQARRMADRGVMFHQALDPVQSACSLGWVGENVAFGYRSTDALVRAWMRSPEHRRNLLFRAYRQIGVGAVQRDGTWFVVQLFGEEA